MDIKNFLNFPMKKIIFCCLEVANLTERLIFANIQKNRKPLPADSKKF